MKVKNIITGILFILGATLLIASAFVTFENISFWSVAAAVVLVAILIESAVKKVWFGIFGSLAILYAIFRVPLDWPYVSVWVLLGGAVLVSIGLHLLFGGKKSHYVYKHHPHSRMEQRTENDVNPVIDVKFSDATRYLHVENLESCTVYCKFGAAEVYFEQATLKDNKAEVNLECKFGGVVLMIPKSWKVIDHISSAMGGVNFSGYSNATENAPELTLKGEVMLGGLEIKYI